MRKILFLTFFFFFFPFSLQIKEMCLKELLSTLFVQLWKGNLIFSLFSAATKFFLIFCYFIFYALSLNLCRCDVFKEENFLYLAKLCYSIIFFPFSARKNCFHIFSSSTCKNCYFFSCRLTKRKNELNLIANRDATTQLLCQYAKNTQTFNSTGVVGSFLFSRFFFSGRKTGNALFCHTREKLLLSLASRLSEIYFQRFSIIFGKFHATTKFHTRF